MRRLAIVLSVAGVLAIATTRGSVNVPPAWGVLMVAAAAIGAALLVPESWRRSAATGAALVAALASAHLLLRPGMPQVHDTDHVWGLWAYARAVRAGHPLPTWIPWIGAGMPLLGFYGPVSFLSSLPGVLLGLAPVAIWKLTMAQSSVLAALGALAGARLLGASWRGAAIAACALALSPWRLTVVDYRGALGEAVAFAWAPVVATAAIAMCREPSRRGGIWLALSVALLVPTHLITTFCLGVVLVPVLLVDALAMRGEAPASPFLRRFGLAAGTAALGAGLVAVWCVPALAESGATTLPMQTRENAYFVYAQHGLTVPDVAVRRAWDRLRPSLPRRDRAAGGEGEQMPFYAGAVVMALGLTAPWWSRSRRTWGLAAGAAIALAMAWAPVAGLATHLPLVDHVQFPWRFLSTAAVLAALAAGAGIGALLGDGVASWRGVLPAVAVPVLLLLDAAPYAGAAGWIPPYRGVTHWIHEADGTRRPVPVELPAGAMIRVGDLELPPDTTATPVELGWIAYVEWTTPAFYRPLLHARGPEDFGEAGISRFFLAGRERPIEIAARPYATLDGVDAGPFTRGVGRIELKPAVPERGAKLVVREQMFPGWRARVDGRDTPIGTAGLGFMTIDLPAGTHDVVMEYTQGTRPRRIGLAISVLSLGLGVWHRFAKRNGARP